MSQKKYDIISIKKAVTKENLLENIIIYLYSRLGECVIESNENNNIYTLLISSKSNQKTKIQLPYIVLEIIIHSDSCAINFHYSKARPAFNIAFAAVAVPIFLPASGILLGTAALRLWHGHSLRKDVVRYIESFVS